jgi:Kef-type K+ transport system membrane component KefB
MFVAGLELDLGVLREYKRAAIIFGLIAFILPFLAGFSVGLALGWSLPATFLLGALISSHTLIEYPTIRDAGLSDNPAVASAVGATVLTDTLALTVLAVVAGTQTGSGSAPVVVAEIVVGLAVLLLIALVVLPRIVDAAFRYWGSDRVARYLVVIVALLVMAMLAEVFGIEGIVGAFFAGLALNRLVPNEAPSMDRVEFFGAAVFIPIFLVSIGLLLEPKVMFTLHTLGLGALLCAAALLGKAVACTVTGSLFGFSWRDRLAMYVLSIPQAAATLATTLIGYELGLFGTSVVNAVLVLILVTIVVSALLTQKVISDIPAGVRKERPLGHKILVISPSSGPSDAAVRTATLLTRPDGGHSDLLMTRTEEEPTPELGFLRALEKRICRHGFDGRIQTEVGDVRDAVAKAVRMGDPSLVIVDDPSFELPPGPVPVLVVDGDRPEVGKHRLIAADGATTAESEIQRRLAPREPWPRFRRAAAP